MKKLFLAIAITGSTSAFSGNYAGLEGGYGFVDIKAKQTAQTLANLSGRTVTYTYDKATFSGRAYFGFSVMENASVEVGYFQTSNLNATYTITGASAKESYSANGIDASLVYKPTPEGVFFKGGFHTSKISGDGSLTIGGTTYNIASTSKSGTGLLAGIGYEGKFGNSQDVNWRAGWSHYNKVGGLSDANVNLIYVGISKNF